MRLDVEEDDDDNLDAYLNIRGIRLKPQDLKALKKIARQECRSLVQQVRYYIEKGIERDSTGQESSRRREVDSLKSV
jgi:hypothetical protein